MRVSEVRLGLGVMEVLGRPKGSYPESFASLSLFLAEIEGCVTLVTKIGWLGHDRS